MRIKHCLISASALCLTVTSITARAADVPEKPGSAYLQCDGKPNNVSDGEAAARFLGAVTQLGLFAPPPESPDASKRKFGDAGVAACTALLEGDKKEGNPNRRLELLLGRAIHQIEAKHYDAAMADVALARGEATTAGLTTNPYFVRSRGRAFDAIDSAALLRMNRLEDARSAALRRTDLVQYSLYPLISSDPFSTLIEKPSAEEDLVLGWRARLFPALLSLRADRLELAGRFGDAARMRDALAEFDSANTPELNSSSTIAAAAVSHALAGQNEFAADRAKAAQANADVRRTSGKPESDAAEFVELMDLYGIVQSANAGDLKTARRLFAARSQWVGASSGAVMEVNRRLRNGAAKDDLIGGMSRDSSEIWRDKAAADLAARLAKDSDNKTLFRLIPAMVPEAQFTALTKQTWNTTKSRLLLDVKKKDDSGSRMEILYQPGAQSLLIMDSYALHAALLAKARGHAGYVLTPLLTDNLVAASFRTGNRGDKGLPDDLFLDANDVIAKLGQEIPSPEVLATRKKQKA